MVTLRVIFTMADKTTVEVTHEYNDGSIIEGMELRIGDLPFMSVPFRIHGERYHTICSGPDEDEVRVVEW